MSTLQFHASPPDRRVADRRVATPVFTTSSTAVCTRPAPLSDRSADGHGVDIDLREPTVIDLRDPVRINRRDPAGRDRRVTARFDLHRVEVSGDPPTVLLSSSSFGRMLVDLACWVVLGGPAILAGAAAAQVHGPLPLVWAASAMPVLLLPAYPLFLTAVARRRRALFAVAAAVIAVHVALVAPASGFLGGSPAEAAETLSTSLPVRVVTANLFLGNDQIEIAGERILTADADVVLLQEVTPAHARALESLFSAYPYRFVDARGGAFGFAILSRWPLSGASQMTIAGHPLVAAVLDINGQALEVWNVHPPAPRDGASGRVWAAHLRELGARATAVEGALLVAGDFNATRWTPELRPLLTSGLTDAHQATGRGLAATWPANAVVPPFLLLDHVFVSADLAVASVTELPAGHSDHRPVLADLMLRG